MAGRCTKKRKGRWLSYIVPYMASNSFECLSGCAHNPILIPAEISLPSRECKRKEPLSGHFVTVPTALPFAPGLSLSPLFINRLPGRPIVMMRGHYLAVGRLDGCPAPDRCCYQRGRQTMKPTFFLQDDVRYRQGEDGLREVLRKIE